MDKHVRARCKTTGGVAAISEKALRLGMFPDWVRADGPTPKQPKPRVQIGDQKARRADDADTKSADEEKE